MDIAEVQKERKALENQIQKLLTEFENATDTRIGRVEIVRPSTIIFEYGESVTPAIQRVSLDVGL